MFRNLLLIVLCAVALLWAPLNGELRAAPSDTESKALADLTDFLVERFNAEIGQYVIDTVSDRACDRDKGEAVRFFEHLCDLKSQFNEDLTTSYVMLKEALKQDIDLLPFKLMQAWELKNADGLARDVSVSKCAESDYNPFPEPKLADWNALWDTACGLRRDSEERLKAAADAYKAATDDAARTAALRRMQDELKGKLETSARLKLLLAVGRVVREAQDSTFFARFETFDTKVEQRKRLLRNTMPLFIEIAQSQDEVDVRAALDKVSSPVGAWRLKRTENIASLGALVGGFRGTEWLKSPQVETTRAHSAIAGMFAPVGIDFSLPLAKNSTVGLFVSVIDVGNLVSARLKEDEGKGADVTAIDSEPKVGFAQVYSPGAYLRFGLGETPLVLGWGVSYTPGLRTAQTSAGEVRLDATRYVVFLAVDITILPIY